MLATAYDLRPKTLEPIRWDAEADALVLLDQTRLPTDIVYLSLSRTEEVWEAIKMLRVRGAPAIGISAAFALYLGLRGRADASLADFRAECDRLTAYLNGARPTAVNLRWALERMNALVERTSDQSRPAALDALLAEAQLMLREDQAICRAIGEHGAALLAPEAAVLTHCNAGGLATTGWGTALAPVYVAHESGRPVAVIADETRPLLQGARLTAFELQAAGIPVTVICDNMAATVMRQGKVGCVIVGADRVVANGDFANKIGTYGVALLARAHHIPFYCAVPLSTIDLRLEHGDQIPIEERPGTEISHGFGSQTVPDGAALFNPAFDVTPADLVTAFITEKGVVRPPFRENLRRLFDEV